MWTLFFGSIHSFKMAVISGLLGRSIVGLNSPHLSRAQHHHRRTSQLKFPIRKISHWQTKTLILASANGREKMTQKGKLFKGQQKKKSIPPNRHGKVGQTRRGKRYVKPSKFTKDMDMDREVSKFINHCNEIKAATVAKKEGGQLSIIKPPPESTSDAKK